VVEPGEVHVYVMFDQLSPAARRGWDHIRAFVAERTGRAPAATP
jgi:hypothetical protein